MQAVIGMRALIWFTYDTCKVEHIVDLELSTKGKNIPIEIVT